MIPITETPIYRSPRFTAPFSVNFAVNQGFAVVGILAIGAICANGDKNGANGNPLAWSDWQLPVINHNNLFNSETQTSQLGQIGSLMQSFTEWQVK